MKSFIQSINQSVIQLFSTQLPLLWGGAGRGSSDIDRMFYNMGFFDDQSGILRRYKREREGWDEHLQNTRKFVIEAMQGKNNKSAAVLGSGWLLDVPIEEMSHYFEKVYLYDLRHPTAVKKQIKPLNNVELCVCDISGFAASVYQYTKQYRNSKTRPPIYEIQPQVETQCITSLHLDLSGFDFVFSCNILNQLDILLIDYMSQVLDLSHEETTIFRNIVQQYHINLLPQNRSCLVADYEEVTFTPDGKEIARRKSVDHPITQRTDAKRWTWKFDTKMKYYNDRITFLETMGVKI